MPMIYFPQFVYFVRMPAVIKINDAANIKYEQKTLLTKCRVDSVALEQRALQMAVSCFVYMALILGISKSAKTEAHAKQFDFALRQTATITPNRVCALKFIVNCCA